MVSFIMSKKAVQIGHALCKKKLPWLCHPWWKKYNQAFVIAGNESFTLLWSKYGPFLFAEHFHFSHIGGFWAWVAFLRSCHRKWIGFKSRLWLGLSQTLIFWVGGIRKSTCWCVFRIIVLLHNPNAIDIKLTNWWLAILL